MGIVIKTNNFFDLSTAGILKPIIYCGSHKSFADAAISINLLLAEKLAACKKNQRTLQIESYFNQILEQLPNNVVIKDFDVMFNPEYKIDVLRVMIAACKRKNFSILWPGKFENGKLYYAEDGYADFKVFNVEDYDITCVI